MDIEFVTPCTTQVVPGLAPYKLKDNPPKWFTELPQTVYSGYFKSRKDQLFFQMTNGACPAGMSPDDCPDVEPDQVREGRTYRTCSALLSMLQRTIVIPSPADFRIIIDSQGNYQWNSPNKLYSISEHGRIQRPGFKNDFLSLKILSPWVMDITSKSKKESSIFFVGGPQFHEEFPYEVSIGLVDVSSVANMPNVIFYVPIPEDDDISTIEISAGTPLSYMTTTNEEPLGKITSVCDADRYELLNWSSNTPTFNPLQFSKKFLSKLKNI
jgi:hypothetical protein